MIEFIVYCSANLQIRMPYEFMPLFVRFCFVDATSDIDTFIQLCYACTVAYFFVVAFERGFSRDLGTNGSENLVEVCRKMRTDINAWLSVNNGRIQKCNC